MGSDSFLCNVPLDLPPTLIGLNALIRSGTVIYRGSLIGDNFQTGHNVLVREECLIGDNVSIGTSTIIEHHVVIGNDARLHSGCFVPEYTILESNVWLGPRVTITNSKFPNRANSKQNLQGVTIKSGAVIGANVTLLPGVTIGYDSIVGAGSVVTKDIPDSVIAYGVPAKVYPQNPIFPK